MYVHDERPIEEAVLYMTVTSGEGAEYLVVGVSETLSTLACAMSNGKVDLWNLDQAMRDVPISGGHPDVITALLFLDKQQLLLSADDSGNIMAWFVRPSRWKGQLAFQLHTPVPAKDPAAPPPSTSVVVVAPAPVRTHQRMASQANPDPIKDVLGVVSSGVPGIGCMSFHSASSHLFCGHRNGHIIVWDLSAILAFIERVAADPLANWFVNAPAHHHTGQQQSNQHNHTRNVSILAPTNANASHARMPSGSSTPQLSTQLGTASLLQLPVPGSRPTSSLGSILSQRRSAASAAAAAAANFSSARVEEPLLPIKDQLALIAKATKPCRTIHAHDAGVSSLHVIPEPPSFLSCASGDHVAHVWSLQGEPMGKLDPVTGLAKGYEMSAPPIPSATGAPASTTSSAASKKAAAAAAAAEQADPWLFRVDVASRAASDRASTHQVLKGLERMALEAAAHQEEQALLGDKGSARSIGTAAALRSPVESPQDKGASQPRYPLALPPVSLASPLSAKTKHAPSSSIGGTK